MDNFDRAYLQELAYKWKNKQLTEAEQQYLAHWEASQLDNLLVLPNDASTPEAIKKRMLNKLLKELAEESTPAKTTKLWPRIFTVAAAVAAIAFGVWFYNTSRYPEAGNDLTLANYKNNIAPGGNRATLTSNGKSINLSDTKTGLAINAAQLTYNDGTKIDPSALGMTEGDSRALEVITPRGGTYFVILQDGTKVWLNADSKLEFLSDYRNKLQRIVKIEGEAYFEVAKNKRKPFMVQSAGQNITVLGTHFNISAYEGEGIRTTLLEGSVSVRHLEGSAATRDLLNSTNKRSLPAVRDDVVLKPNQQSLLTPNAGITVTEADPNATAWVKGAFSFNNASLEVVMKQLARWYDVEVVYPNGIPNRRFTGDLDRKLTAAEALDLLRFTKVKFKIEGKKIIVTK
jgi:ferric-dicitrate binding protein FerR (iron transport regulator)